MGLVPQDTPACVLHVSRFTFHVSRFTFHVLRFTFHVLRFTFHVSRFTFHVSRFTPHIMQRLGLFGGSLFLRRSRLSNPNANRLRPPNGFVCSALRWPASTGAKLMSRKSSGAVLLIRLTPCAITPADFLRRSSSISSERTISTNCRNGGRQKSWHGFSNLWSFHG